MLMQIIKIIAINYSLLPFTKKKKNIRVQQKRTGGGLGGAHRVVTCDRQGQGGEARQLTETNPAVEIQAEPKSRQDWVTSKVLETKEKPWRQVAEVKPRHLDEVGATEDQCGAGGKEEPTGAKGVE